MSFSHRPIVHVQCTYTVYTLQIKLNWLNGVYRKVTFLKPDLKNNYSWFFKEISTEVQNIWDEAHKVTEDPTEVKDEEGPEENSNHDTLGSTEANSSRCCGAEVTKVN